MRVDAPVHREGISVDHVEWERYAEQFTAAQKAAIAEVQKDDSVYAPPDVDQSLAASSPVDGQVVTVPGVEGTVVVSSSMMERLDGGLYADQSSYLGVGDVGQFDGDLAELLPVVTADGRLHLASEVPDGMPVVAAHSLFTVDGAGGMSWVGCPQGDPDLLAALTPEEQKEFAARMTAALEEGVGSAVEAEWTRGYEMASAKDADRAAADRWRALDPASRSYSDPAIPEGIQASLVLASVRLDALVPQESRSDAASVCVLTAEAVVGCSATVAQSAVARDAETGAILEETDGHLAAIPPLDVLLPRNSSLEVTLVDAPLNSVSPSALRSAKVLATIDVQQNGDGSWVAG